MSQSFIINDAILHRYFIVVPEFLVRDSEYFDVLLNLSEALNASEDTSGLVPQILHSCFFVALSDLLYVLFLLTQMGTVGATEFF